MNRSEPTRSQTWSILCGAALMLSLGLGLFQTQMVRDIRVTSAEFSLAIAIQNIVWGLAQALAGILADRWARGPSRWQASSSTPPASASPSSPGRRAC
jgi:MFS family permease